MSVANDQASTADLARIIPDLTPGDLALVTTLAEALRDGDVTAADLHGLSDEEWLALIARRRAA